MESKTKDQEMQTTQRSPEMELLLNKSKTLRKIYEREKTEEAHENLKEAERQRYKQYYKENREMENKRNKENHKQFRENKERYEQLKEKPKENTKTPPVCLQCGQTNLIAKGKNICHKCRYQKEKRKKQVDFNASERTCDECNTIKVSFDFSNKDLVCCDCKAKIQQTSEVPKIKCECGGSYTDHKSKQKHEQTETHQFFIEHKMTKIKYFQKFVICDCGLTVPKHHHNDHVQTKLHFNNLESKNIQR